MARKASEPPGAGAAFETATPSENAPVFWVAGADTCDPMMRPMLKRLLPLFAVLLLSPFSAAKTATPTPTSPNDIDVRLVIDISGSMKQNDPHNLRQPAVRMVTQLLPAGSEAGVWTFGQYANMLVPHGKVDAAWRKMALSKAGKINSVGLYTNIGKALEVASDDFYTNRRFDHTHFILLTDGMVDVPGNASVDAKARHQVLTRILDRIKRHGAHIDTIALSPNADRSLLKRLAVETGGTFTIAESADALSRAFLRAFDQAAPSEQVPIKNNGFHVDAKVREFTALIFHKPGSQDTRLKMPDGKPLSAKTHPDSVHWLAENRYDLITVDKPQAGDWGIDAQLEPDSRVTIVSDLRMAVTQLPANFYAGDHLNLDIAFYDDSSKLTNADFLKLMTVTLSLKTQDGRVGSKVLSNTEKVPADGVYHDSISKLTQPGVYQFRVLADGKTFQRENTQTITLRAPVNVEVQGEGDGAKSHYNVVVTPQNPNLDTGKTVVAMQVTGPGGKSRIVNLNFDKSAHQWQAALTADEGPGDYRVNLRIKGQTREGQDFIFAPNSLTAAFPRKGANGAQYQTLNPTVTPPPATPLKPIEAPAKPAPAPTPPPAAKPTSAPSSSIVPNLASKVEKPKPVKPAAQKPAAPAKKSLWARFKGYILGIVGLLVVSALGWGGWRFWQRRKAGREDELDDVEAITAEPVVPVVEAEPEVPGDELEPEPEPEPEMETDLDPEPQAEIEPELESEPDASVESAPEDAMAGIEDALADVAGEDESSEPDEIPVVGTPEPLDADEAEKLAEQILADNAADDEYSLEDFDISDVEDLPDENTKDEKEKGDQKPTDKS